MKNDPKQRFLLMMAMGLTFLLVMQYIFPPPPRQAPARTVPAVTIDAVDTAPSAPAGEHGGSAAVDLDIDTDYLVTVRTPGDERNEHGYEAVFSSVGGGLRSYRLLGFYREPGDFSDDNRIILLDRLARGRESLRLNSVTYGTSRQDLRQVQASELRYQLVEVPENAMVVPAPDGQVRRGGNLVFRAVLGDWEIIRTYRFTGSDGSLADFCLGFDLEWRNLSDTNRLLSYSLAGPTGLLPDDDSANFGVINILTARQPHPANAGTEIERKTLKELSDADGMSDVDNRANLAWVGAKNRFFVSIMAADSNAISDSNGIVRRAFPGEPGFVPTAKDIQETLKSQPTVSTDSGVRPVFEDVQLVVEPGTVQAGQSFSASYLLYAGPAVDTWMETADPRLNGVVSYTIRYLDFISRWLVQLLTFFDGILGNYGLAIIAVTIIIKVLLHPLNRKSFVSMNKMTKLAPMMKEIQKKYANDKAKMQVEMGKFYKEHGVSMAGGCLPVFLQLPIFFALYGAFSQGFSMRHAAFIPGWIQDLSKPDSVYDLGFTIPLLGSSHISLLPILYLGLQYIQMSLQPKPSDPQQAQQQKIMKFMPLMFVFIFYSMPAGLVLYFTVSALAGVAESWWMRNRLLPRLGLGDAPVSADSPAAPVQAGTGAVPAAPRKKKKRK